MSNSTFAITSISRKVFTALAGLFLMTFLAVHMSTNLLMLKSDDGAAFRQAVDFLVTNPLIKVMEVVLFSGFIIHILLSLFVTIRNWIARPVSYKVAPKSRTYFMSKYMFHTGIMIFIFLLLHLWHFFAIKIGWKPQMELMADKHDFYPLAIYLFQQPLFSVFYLISFVFLGFHLSHALQSGFQTLGLHHNKYTPAVKIISTVYAIIIALGFSAIPIYFLFIYGG